MQHLSTLLQTKLFKQPDKPVKPLNQVQELTNFYYSLKNWDRLPPSFFKETKDPKYSYPRNCADAKKVLQFFSLDEAKEELCRIFSEGKLYNHDFRISTIIKKGIKKLKSEKLNEP